MEKVFVVLCMNYGDLVYECGQQDLKGVYSTKEKAINKIIELKENDETNSDYKAYVDLGYEGQTLYDYITEQDGLEFYYKNDRDNFNNYEYIIIESEVL
jgi:hypothetical protein